MPLTQPEGPSALGFLFQEAFLQYVDGSGSTQSIVFDAVLSEDWTDEATVTEHPVEEGADVADHVRVKLPKVSIKIRVSNEPLDSNMWADPQGGAGQTSPLQLSVPTPEQDEFSGIVTVPRWVNDRALQGQLLIGANILSGIAKNATDAAVDATPLGNLTSKAIKGFTRTTQTGNEVIAYDVPSDVSTFGIPIRSIGDIAGAEVFGLVTSLVPAGEEVDVPVVTDAGLPGGDGTPDSITAQTIQWSGAQDFAARMVELLVGLQQTATQFTVYGSKRTEVTMVLESIAQHRGATEETGTGIEITIGLKRIRLVSTNTVAAPLPKIPSAKAPVNSGAQDPYAADTGTMQSFFRKALEGALNFFSGGGAP